MNEGERGLGRNKGLEGHAEGLFCEQRATAFGADWSLVIGI